MNSSLALHNVFGDHMVLQREKPIRITGTASAKSQITGSFLGHQVTTTTDADGNWALVFPAAPAGGPYELVVSHTCHPTARIVLHDILIGDVWFCSGQSNMEFPVWGDGPFFRLRDGLEVAAAAHDNGLRLFQSPLCVEVDGPCTEPPGRPSWKPATTEEAVKEFSAVGYWFGATLREAFDEKVPIGLINSSWGGTMIEPWISEDAFRAAGRQKDLARLSLARDLSLGDSAIQEKAAQEFALAQAELRNWIDGRFLVSDPAATAEALASWARPGIDTSAWSPAASSVARMAVPRPGITWFRCEFDLPEDAAGCKASVHVDSVNDCDETFLDGEKIGATGCDVPGYWMAPRNYAATLRATPGGRHVLAIRAMDHLAAGGVTGSITVSVDRNGTCEVLDLTQADWLRRDEFVADIQSIGTRPDVPQVSADPRNNCQTPSTLFNAMVNPYLDLALKGVIWYQGCSNAGNPSDYLALQKLWIDDWRRAWKDDSLPFLITQLAAYNGHHPDERSPDDFWKPELPGDNVGFAPLREVQDAMFDYPGVGVACTIDIGDHSDIHPANKKDVGIRLANEAMRLAYGDAAALPGPRVASVTREGTALRVAFDNVGDGLFVKGDAFGPHLFAIAGADGKFVWADAALCDDNTVLVSSDKVPEPVHVQYAFSAFPPDANLFRKGDGFPVFPFRTNKPF